MIEFDTASGIWVASGEAAVRAALAHPLLRARPPAEPVPRALLGRATGDVFALLVRMNDGEFHARHRPGVEQRASAIRREDVEAAAARSAAALCDRLPPDELLPALPVRAMADVLGVAEGDLDATAAHVLAFVRGIAAGASAEDIARSDAACEMLMRQGERLGLDRATSANRIAFMQQACDATAGLIGLAALRFLSHGIPDDWSAAIAQVARDDPRILNTRRYAAADLELCGQPVRAGDAILVMLASAPGYGFGAGAHACPGERIAITIAAAALRELSARGALLRLFGTHTGFRPLPNARIPTFGTRAERSGTRRL